MMIKKISVMDSVSLVFTNTCSIPLWMGMTMTEWLLTSDNLLFQGCPDAQQPRVDKILTSRLTLHIYIYMYIYICPYYFHASFPHMIQVDI